MIYSDYKIKIISKSFYKKELTELHVFENLNYIKNKEKKFGLNSIGQKILYTVVCIIKN